MAKKLILGLVLVRFDPNLAQKSFSWSLPPLDVIHCCKLSLYAISKKTNELNLIKSQKNKFQARFWPLWHKFGPPKNFSWILPLLDVKNCCKLSLYAFSRKTNEPNLRKWQKKPSFGPNFGPIGPHLSPKNFFREFYVYQMLDIVACFRYMQFQGKLMHQT